MRYVDTYGCTVCTLREGGGGVRKGGEIHCAPSMQFLLMQYSTVKENIRKTINKQHEGWSDVVQKLKSPDRFFPNG